MSASLKIAAVAAPTFEDVVNARTFVSQYLPKTPLVYLPRISEELGCDYYAKLENLQPTGAFKVRGGVNLVGHEVSTGGDTSLSDKTNSARSLRSQRLGGELFSTGIHRRVAESAEVAQRKPTLITASTGNHGQS